MERLKIANAEPSIVDLRTAGLELDSPDLWSKPTHAALVACRLEGFKGTTSITALREPFAVLAEQLHVPGRFSATVHLGVRGTRDEPQVVAELVVTVIGDVGEVQDEAQAASALLEWQLAGSGQPFRVRFVPASELAWPGRRHGLLIRQRTAEVGGTGSGVRLPLRFQHPGPSAGRLLVGALAAAGPGTDLFVSITPTALSLDEQQALELAGTTAARLAEEHADLHRDAATAVDARLSFRTDAYVLQLLLASESPMPELTARAIASAFTASFDSERYEGGRVVSRPQRFVSGGFELAPLRDPETELRWLRAGLPRLGWHGSRDLADLVTSTEVGFCFGWPADAEGGLPGLAPAAGEAPTLPPSRGNVRLGTDDRGRDAWLADEDRRLHLAAIGATGFGKTTLFGSLAEQDAKAGRPTIVIDPHEDLVARVARAVPRRRRSEVVWFDGAHGRGDSVDLLRMFPHGSPAQERFTRELLPSAMTADMNRDFAGPVFQRTMGNLLWCLALTGGRLRDVDRLLAEPDRLAATAAETGRDDLAVTAAEVRWWSGQYRGETISYVAGKLAWLASPGHARTWDASSPTVRLQEVIEGGGVLLVTPGTGSAGRLAMSVLLDALLTCAEARTPASPTLPVYLDEAQLYFGHVLSRLCNEGRKRGLALHIGSQHLANLEGHLDALLGNAGTLIIGRSSAATAAFAEREFDVQAGRMGALANFTAIARLPVSGDPSPPFRIHLPRPSGPRGPGIPPWLITATTERRNRADLAAHEGADDLASEVAATDAAIPIGDAHAALQNPAGNGAQKRRSRKTLALTAPEEDHT